MAQKRKLTAKQARFVTGIVEGKTQVQAYLCAGYKDCKYAAVNASDVAKKPLVAAEIERQYALCWEHARRRLKKVMNEAIDTYEELVGCAKPEDKTRILLANSILDRVGLKPKEQVDVSSDVVVRIKYADGKDGTDDTGE